MRFAHVASVAALAALAALAATILSPGIAQAQKRAPAKPPAAPAPPAAPVEDANTKEAREHFDRGVSLVAEESWDAALAEFLRSREIAKGRAATKNAAVCFRKLHRYDEAIEMFESLLADFPDLAADDKQFANKSVGELGKLVGYIQLKGSLDGVNVNIDGRERGTANARVRVSAGTHLARFHKPGFSPIEKRIEIVGEQTQTIELQMVALAQAGNLNVVEAQGRVAEVVVDGVVVGKTPWEGQLATGPHVVTLRADAPLGAQPTAATVKLNDVSRLSLTLEPLEATARIELSQPTATITLDGVAIGRGPWEGNLKTGNHHVEVTAEGFFPMRRDLTLERNARQVLQLKLERDPDSPLWADARHHFLLELLGGAAIAPSFSGAPACVAPCASGLGFGLTGRLVVGYELDSGVQFGVAGGYLTATQHLSDRPATIQAVGKPAHPGSVADSILVRGLTLGGMGGFHTGATFPFTLRLGAGVLIGSARDQRDGSFAYGATTNTQSFTDSANARYVLLTPKLADGATLALRDGHRAVRGAVMLDDGHLKKRQWPSRDCA